MSNLDYRPVACLHLQCEQSRSAHEIHGRMDPKQARQIIQNLLSGIRPIPIKS